MFFVYVCVWCCNIFPSTEPNSAENFEASAIDSSTIEAKWEAPSEGKVDFYILHTVPVTEIYTVPSAQRSFTLHGLNPGTLYNIMIKTKVSDALGETRVANVSTREYICL